jgi:outer membrane protein OmpA-like peptidoglycan-associated protein
MEGFPMIRKFTVALAALALVTGCTTVDPVTGERETNRTATGAIIGAIVGAGAGTLAGGDDRRNAMIGAGIGALAGAAIGNYMDRTYQNLRERLANTGVGVERVSQEQIRLIFPADLTFDFNRDTVKSQFVGTLRETGGVLREYDQTTVDVIGHADSVGSDEYNLDLSDRRADNVADILESGGVQEYRILKEGRGERQPIASNETDTGRARNRRVEVYISAFQG